MTGATQHPNQPPSHRTNRAVALRWWSAHSQNLACLPRRVLLVVPIVILAALPLFLPVRPARAAPATPVDVRPIRRAAATPTAASPVPPVATPTTREGTTDGRGGPLQCLSDPGICFNALLTDLLRGVADTLKENLDRVLVSDLNVVTRTPERFTYDHPLVRQLWSVSRLIADQGLLLVLIVGALNIIVRPRLGVAYHEWAELIPRVIVGGLFLNLSLEGAAILININNALCDTFGAATLLPTWAGAGGQQKALADIVAVLVYLVTAFVLLFQMLLRLALLDVLLIVMPLAALCWVLPQTQGLARTWSNLFTGAVLTQFVQVIALKLGVALFVEMGPDLAANGSVLLANLIGVALLVLTLKIPALMRAHGAGDGLGLARFLIYRQIAASLSSGGRSRGSQMAAGGGSAAANTAQAPSNNGGANAPRGAIAPYYGGAGTRYRGGGESYTVHVYAPSQAHSSGEPVRALRAEQPHALPAPRTGTDGVQ